MTESVRKFVVTVGYSGLAPVAPGTVGTLVSAAIVYGLVTAGQRFGLPWWGSQGMILAVAVAASVTCVTLGPWTVAFFHRKDPGPCVIDELAGFCTTLLFLPITRSGWWLTLLVAFVGFRVFDVLKPPPARRLERLPDGWGILTDDLLAGVYANVACQVFLRLVI